MELEPVDDGVVPADAGSRYEPFDDRDEAAIGDPVGDQGYDDEQRQHRAGWQQGIYLGETFEHFSSETGFVGP